MFEEMLSKYVSNIIYGLRAYCDLRYLEKYGFIVKIVICGQIQITVNFNFGDKNNNEIVNV